MGIYLHFFCPILTELVGKVRLDDRIHYTNGTVLIQRSYFIKVADFKKVNRIGQGTYGFVYRAKLIDKEHSGREETVALKRIIMHNESQDGRKIFIKVLTKCNFTHQQFN